MALATACTALPPAAFPPGTPPVELAATPFHPQAAWQCGPAALATVLGSSGVAADPDDLADQVYLPDRRGSLQVELVAATRRAGRVPWVVHGGLPGLAAELAAGYPVLVLQDMGRLGIRRWHYAVVIGLDPRADEVLLRSGRKPRLRLPTARFATTWAASGYWGLVVPASGDLPATATPASALDTLAATEGLLPAATLAAGWTAAAARWPADPDLRFGAANAAHELGDHATAEAGYRAILGLAPGHLPARNNLADLLLARDCAAEGRALAAAAFAASRADEVPASYRAAIADTWQRAQACSAAPR